MFTMGLKNEIRRILLVSQGVTLGEVMESAKHIEFYDENDADKKKSATAQGGNQSQRFPSRGFGHGGQGSYNQGSYHGARGRGQGGSQWTQSGGNFTGRKRDRDTFFQGSVAQSLRGSMSTGGGSGNVKCWQCGQLGHRKSDCKAPRCFHCGDFGHHQFECPKKKDKGPATTPANHGPNNGGGQRGQFEGGARKVGTPSATASTPLHAVQTEEVHDTSVVRGRIRDYRH